MAKVGLSYRLLFGPLAAVIFAIGIASLPLMIPAYSDIRQTVSEIGEIGSPARAVFTIMMCCVSACILVFASGVRDYSVEVGRSASAAYLIAFMAVSAAGVGIFAYPHPLHNVFGMSELVGYQAPLALALTWRREPRTRALVIFSWVMFAVVWVAIVLNLTSLERHGPIWAHVRPVYGLLQRALFGAWFAWLAGAGLMLIRFSSGNQQKQLHARAR